MVHRAQAQAHTAHLQQPAVCRSRACCSVLQVADAGTIKDLFVREGCTMQVRCAGCRRKLWGQRALWGPGVVGGALGRGLQQGGPADVRTVGNH